MSIASDDETLLRELVSRLAAEQAQVLVGQLPESLPIDLPLPEQTQIIGSVVGAYNEPGYYQIFLTVPRSRQQVELFYRQQLQSAGWTIPALSRSVRTGGFVSAPSDAEPVTFCHRASSTTLTLATRFRREEQTAVSLTVSGMDYSLCDERAARFDRIGIPLPELLPPADSNIRGIRGGGSESSWVSSATIETAIDRQSLLAHYVQQLEQGDWARQGSGNGDTANWSYLVLLDQEGQRWQALLSIMPSPTAPTLSGFERYVATIIASQTGVSP